MKKIFLAVLTAGVLASGAMAGLEAAIPQSKDDIYASVENLAKKEQLECPYKVDTSTTNTAVKFIDGKFIHEYMINSKNFEKAFHISVTKKNIEKIQNKLFPLIKDDIQDRACSGDAKVALENGVIVVSSYRFDNGLKLGEVSVTKDDCRS